MSYNGWTNKATWNVALWINNDEPTYSAAVEFMKDYKGDSAYRDFCEETGLSTQKTPDGYEWVSELLDYQELNIMMKGLR